MIRLFQDSDWTIVKSWWDQKNIFISKELLSETTYLIETKNKPAVCASLLLTNCKYVAWIENLISDPNLEKEERKNLVNQLFNHLENEAKVLGYKAVSFVSYVEKLKPRYVELGYQPTLRNITYYVKSI